MTDLKCSFSSCNKEGKGKSETSISSSPEISESKTSISACSCGPECGPEKCDGRNRSALVGWDSLRSKIFVCLFVAFLLWLVIYVPISLTLFKSSAKVHGS